MKSFYTRLAGLALSLTATLCTVAATGKQCGEVYRDNTVRISVVTDGMLRMEYAPDGKFVDAPSFIAVNRDGYPDVDARVDVNGKDVTVTTPKMRLEYRRSKGGFTADNLRVTSLADGRATVWTPGMQQHDNLWGTVSTLDRWDGPDYLKKDSLGNWTATPQQLEKGVLARDGWTLIDDSEGLLFDTSDPSLPWVKERKSRKGAQDWYLMMYGNDYKGALKDFTVLSGKIPMPPRYAFGYWWSRWWAYSEHELRQLVANFEEYNIPLEILVIDMDWHYTDEAHGGWTGWTWNRRLFPQPEKFLNHLRDNDLKITLNLHPASGVKKFEAAYPRIATDMGIDPATERDIPWVSSDKRFINTMFRNILNPMTDQGVSFWWLDWQQEPNDPVVKNLSNIWWLNHTFFTKMQNERQCRPLIFHRWGGLGNHRYQIGFSGDSYSTWKTLDFMPYFTATAANVGYGYWCHDIGGFYMAPGDSVINPEMYLRSFQFGAYSPIMRNHSTKRATLNKEPWRFDRQTLDNLRNIIRRRYEMIPYIYTSARQAYDTGVSICRPMYYDYPDCDEAYRYKGQYMFGDRMIVAPVTSPLKGDYSTVEVWLPEGRWYENATGTLLEGGRVYNRPFAIDEVPVYIKAGSILPYHTDTKRRLRTNEAAYTLTVIPGADSGDFDIYEDNGDDKRYAEEYALTRVSSVRSGSTLTVDIEPRRGQYDGMPDSRRFAVKALAVQQPLGVKVDGADAPYRYVPEELAVVVDLPELPCSVARRVEILLPEGDADMLADGTVGNMRRFVNAFVGLKDQYPKLEVTEEFGPLSIIYEAIGYSPEQTQELIGQFRERYGRIAQVIDAQPMSDKARAWLKARLNVSEAND